MKTQCFKIKRGTDYDKEVKKHFSLLDNWKNVFEKVSDLLGEKITRLAFTAENLVIDTKELTNEENIKLFKQSGELKQNTKKAKAILQEYHNIIKEEGLTEFEELRYINFRFGAMRVRGQELESFRTSEDDIYYKADFDLEKKTGGLVEPISEIEYQEKYLSELKKLDEVN